MSHIHLKTKAIENWAFYHSAKVNSIKASLIFLLFASLSWFIFHHNLKLSMAARTTAEIELVIFSGVLATLFSTGVVTRGLHAFNMHKKSKSIEV